MWHPDDYLDRLYRKLEEQRKTASQEPSAAERERLRGRLQDLLGRFEEEEAPLQPKLLESEEMADGITRQRIEYSTAEGLRVPAYLLLPKEARTGRRPAVLAWHGHGYGSREAVGLLPDGTLNPGPPGIHRNFAVELARRGLVVLVPEIVGFGDRRIRQEADGEPGSNSCFPIGAALLLAGRTIAGLRAWEARRAADYLLTRDDVDGQRIGCFGFSGGGMVASLSAALDDRMKATVITGYSNTYKTSILDRRHCLDNYIPGILTEAEMPDLLALIAPRELYLEAGTEDHLFPVEQVKAVYQGLAELYQSLGAGDAIGLDVFEGKHEICGRRSFDWIASRLKA
ncbi:dienelactone hydrolase family protein [Paenibacillus mucilaginosus]|uniref:Dienelactone hydrolase-like protein n=1 Tax=Paenibacillus mucilaginosus (strain KNP414) TaxID=1036673 RepID=F8FGZ8_PAEMK|nr:dienelactone hydrolase family protein [Paenibacillus mucilaginosus]AEI46299.1 dienelactone hydrolase-like protein [Paenibacillus mucilaginosus KNP414]MCG7213586.1 dienelactone hydrolase family protein [Paenibacillus mucilaginosus]WDM27599.1 dienelactone hydrolase family protein [Paenibacillus mucilaginosus]